MLCGERDQVTGRSLPTGLALLVAAVAALALSAPAFAAPSAAADRTITIPASISLFVYHAGETNGVARCDYFVYASWSGVKGAKSYALVYYDAYYKRTVTTGPDPGHNYISSSGTILKRPPSGGYIVALTGLFGGCQGVAGSKTITPKRFQKAHVVVTLSGEKKASISVSVSLARSGVSVEDSVKATVKVTAGKAPLTSVSLGKGLTGGGNIAEVTKSPPGLSGFSLAAGASRSFSFTVKALKAGAAALGARATATSTDGAVSGSDAETLRVGQSALAVTMSTDPQKVTLKVDADGKVEPAHVQVTVRLTNTGTAALKGVSLQSVNPEPADRTQPLDRLTLPHGSLPVEVGTLAGGAAVTRRFPLKVTGDGKYQLSARAVFDDNGAIGRADAVGGKFEVIVPTLVMAATLGPYVHGPTYHRAVRAGYAYKIDVSLHDTSRTNRIVVSGESLWADLSGNAYDGHLQARAAKVYDVGRPSGQATDVRLSPDVVLQPKQTREFSFIVRTRSLNVDWVEGKQASETAGSTTSPAVAIIRPPQVGRLPSGPLDRMKASDVTWLDPAKDVALAGEQCSGSKCRFSLPVDDSDPAPPPWNTLAFGTELALGVPGAIASWTWGTIRGMVWDLPNTAAAWFFGQLYAEDQLLEYWDAMDNAPAGKAMMARYAQAVKARIDKEHAEAKFLADHSPNLLSRIDTALRRHWTQVATQYYKGDWHQAAATMSSEGTKGILNAVSLVAPGALVRVSGIAKLAETYRTAKLARAATEAAQASKALETVSAAEIAAADSARAAQLLTEAEQAAAVESKLPAGTALSPSELLNVGGFNSRDLSAMNKVGDGDLTGGRKIVMVWKGRGKFAALADAIGKPSWDQVKGINIADVKYLAEPASDLGYQAWTEPPELALVEQGNRAKAKDLFVATLKKWFAAKGEAFTAADQERAVARWNERVSEWTSTSKKEVRKLLERARTAEQNGGETTVVWEKEGNFADTAKYPNQEYDVNFKIEETTTNPKTDPFGPRKRYIPLTNATVGATLKRIASDHDALAFLYENGAPLTDADRDAVYTYLREKGIISHGATASFDNASVRAQILTNGVGGYARAADGKWYYVKYLAGQSEYVDPGNFRQVFDGLPLVPNAP